MSILIRGMEMPSRRESCPFCSVVANDEPLCDLLVGELCLFGVACPLVPVPPHGRLIDVDAPIRLEIKIDGGMNMCVTDIYAPTIIEAEDHIGDANEMVGDSE